MSCDSEDIKDCIRRAKGDERWKNATPSMRTAIAILHDCLDRSGIGNEIQACDDDIIEDMLQIWAGIIDQLKNQ